MADAIDAVIDAMRAESERRAERASEEVIRRINLGLDDAAERLADAKSQYRAADYQFVYDTYRAALKDAALEDAFKGIGDYVKKAMPRLLVALQAPRPDAPHPNVLNAVEAVVAYLSDSVAANIPAMAEPYIREALGVAITEPISVMEIVRKINPGLSVAAQQAAAQQIRTMIQLLDQTVINESAKDLGYQYWYYTGPDDVVTRPFCDRVVNKVFPTKALMESDNGQLPNVMITRGGYNCRHRLRPMRRAGMKYLNLEVVEPYEMIEETVGERKAGAKKTANRVIRWPAKVGAGKT